MRKAEIERDTKETQIRLTINLDGTGQSSVSTGLGFFDHMLTLFSAHSKIDLSLDVHGDLEVDGHHSVEDVGIALGQAFTKALGDKKGIRRYGFFVLPMDETLAETAIDFSGRPFLVFNAKFPVERVGNFDLELVNEFWQGFANAAAYNPFRSLCTNVSSQSNPSHCRSSIACTSAPGLCLG